MIETYLNTIPMQSTEQGTEDNKNYWTPGKDACQEEVKKKIIKFEQIIKLFN